MKKYHELPKEFHTMNDRRLALLEKKYLRGLTIAEETELESLESNVEIMLMDEPQHSKKAS